MINKQILSNIYGDLSELSSKNLQLSHWITGDRGKESGYVELMCRLFDDDDFDHFIDKEVDDLKLSDDFVKELRRLRDSLNLYNEEGKTRLEIINDPEWEEIINQAQKVIAYWEAEIPADLLN